MFDEIDKNDNDASMPESKPASFQVVDPKAGEIKLEQPKTSVSRVNALSDFKERLDMLESKGRKRGHRYSIIGLIYSLVICTAVLASGYYIIKEINEFAAQTQEIITEAADSGRTAIHRPKIKPAWKSCEQNEDCVETSRECCTCAAGGRQSAINKLYLGQWNDLLADQCADRVCAGSSQCAYGLAVCEHGYCIFKEATTTAADETPVCISEAQVQAVDASPAECCSGLTRIAPASKLTADGACLLETDSFVCLACPDGTCGALENNCNCPQDCAAATNTLEASAVSLASTSSASAASEALAGDSDGDGLNAEEEARYGTDPDQADSDNDGFSDGDEVRRGYNPLGAGSLAEASPEL